MSKKSTKSILLVEDNADTLEMLAELLKIEGYEVRTAQNGLLALQIVEESRPDVVIADLQMPFVDGIELARKLRTEHGERLRLIALTGSSPKKTFGASREAGFDYYVVKPVTGEQLVPYIENEPLKDD